MPLAAPPPDRDRTTIRPRRRQPRPIAAPLKPAAVAGMALLLALATLREPALVAPTEDAWSETAEYLPTGSFEGGEELVPLPDSQLDAMGKTTLLLPVAISDADVLDDATADGSAAFDEERAATIALRMASRLAWQATGSFTFAPFGGIWAGSWSSAPAVDSGIAIEQ